MPVQKSVTCFSSLHWYGRVIYFFVFSLIFVSAVRKRQSSVGVTKDSDIAELDFWKRGVYSSLTLEITARADSQKIKMPDHWLIALGFSTLAIGGLAAIATHPRYMPWSLRVFIILMGAIALQMSLMQPPMASQHTTVMFLTDSLVLCLAPLIYLYLLSLEKAGKSVNKKQLLHFLPAACALLMTIPFWLLAPAEKIKYTNQGIDITQWRWPSDEATLCLTILQLLLYSPVILLHLNRRWRHYEDHNPAHRVWLLWVVGHYYAMWILSVAMVIWQLPPVLRQVMVTSFWIFSLGAAWITIRNPYAICGAAAKETPVQAASFITSINSMTRLAERVHQHIRATHCYLDPDLNLKKLAQQLNVQPQLLSALFTQHLDCRLPDYLNRYRVEMVKSLLKDESKQYLGVTDIMLQAGFKSNAMFYQCFRDDTGQTPAQFRKAATRELKLV